MPLALGSVTCAEVSLIAGPCWPGTAQPAARLEPRMAIAHAARRPIRRRRNPARIGSADAGVNMMTDLTCGPRPVAWGDHGLTPAALASGRPWRLRNADAWLDRAHRHRPLAWADSCRQPDGPDRVLSGRSDAQRRAGHRVVTHRRCGNDAEYSVRGLTWPQRDGVRRGAVLAASYLAQQPARRTVGGDSRVASHRARLPSGVGELQRHFHRARVAAARAETQPRLRARRCARGRRLHRRPDAGGRLSEGGADWQAGGDRRREHRDPDHRAGWKPGAHAASP